MKMNWNTLLCEKRRREHSSKESSDLRSEFQKDYHRIIQSASFRRLQDKTQVFPLDKSPSHPLSGGIIICKITGTYDPPEPYGSRQKGHHFRGGEQRLQCA